MINIKKNYNNLITNIAILCISVLPILLYLSPVNIVQINLFDFFNILITHSSILLIFIIFAKIIHRLFFLNKSFQKFFFFLSIYFFMFFFFFKAITLFDNAGHYFSLLRIYKYELVIFIYIFSFFLLIYFFKKFYTQTKNLVLIFFFLNFSLSLYDHSKFFFRDKNLIIDEKKNKINFKNQITNHKNLDIYIIVLDAMIGLSKAEKENIINSKKEIETLLENRGFYYHDNFNSNFEKTYLSLTTLLNGEYATDENKKFNNRFLFYPNNLYNKNTNFFSFLNSFDAELFWISNLAAPCLEKVKIVNCVNLSSLNYVLTHTSQIYKYHVLRFLFTRYYANNFIPPYEVMLNYSIFEKKIKKNLNKNNFIFIHVLKPHTPFDRDKNCNKIKALNINESREYYGYNFNCALKTTLNWTLDIKNYDNSLIIILGDHGESRSFNKQLSSIDIQHDINRLSDVFFAYKLPTALIDKCKNLKLPNSQVNVMRFLYNCLLDQKINFLEDKSFLTYREGSKNFGKSKRIK